MIICVICGEFMSFVKLCGTLCYSVVNRTNPPFRLLKQNNSCTFAKLKLRKECNLLEMSVG